MAQPVALIACYWTLGGAYVFGEHDQSPWDFRDRVEAAARVGYEGFGLKSADLRITRDRYGYDGMRAILADNGIRHIEVEALFGWFGTGEARRRSDADRRLLLEAAEQLGAHHMKAAGDFSPEAADTPIEHVAREFETLARQAADAGTVVTLEPIAFSNVNTLGKAIAVVGSTAGRGGGLMLDSWHVTRGGFSLSEIAALPPGAIGGAELDDGTAEPVGNPVEDTLDRRKLCGEGEFDLEGFIRAVQAAGYTGPWGVEIISTEQRARSLDAAASRSYETTIRQFG